MNDRYTLLGIPIPRVLGELLEDVIAAPAGYVVAFTIGVLVAATAFIFGLYASLFM